MEELKKFKDGLSKDTSDNYDNLFNNGAGFAVLVMSTLIIKDSIKQKTGYDMEVFIGTDGDVVKIAASTNTEINKAFSMKFDPSGLMNTCISEHLNKLISDIKEVMDDYEKEKEKEAVEAYRKV